MEKEREHKWDEVKWNGKMKKVGENRCNNVIINIINDNIQLIYLWQQLEQRTEKEKDRLDCKAWVSCRAEWVHHHLHHHHHYHVILLKRKGGEENDGDNGKILC